MLETSIGQMSSIGIIMGQGILDEAQAMLKKAGNSIAMSQRMVFHFRRFFFSVVCISYVFFRLWWCGLRERCENA